MALWFRHCVEGLSKTTKQLVYSVWSPTLNSGLLDYEVTWPRRSMLPSYLWIPVFTTSRREEEEAWTSNEQVTMWLENTAHLAEKLRSLWIPYGCTNFLDGNHNVVVSSHVVALSCASADDTVAVSLWSLLITGSQRPGRLSEEPLSRTAAATSTLLGGFRHCFK